MKCPYCQAADLVPGIRDAPYAYKRESTPLPGVTGDYCPACHAVVLGHREAERVTLLMAKFHQQVNATFVDPAFIANVRKKLQLSQRAAAALFGSSLSTFSRYENGRTKPPGGLVKLLEVLEGHPELLAEVRAV